MTDFLTSLGAIAVPIFLAELADKDALLLVTASARVRARIVFLAGVTAFVMNTALFVTLGSLLIVIVPVYWVRLAGGAVMLAYGLWEARAFVGLREVEEQEARVENTGSPWKAFFALVAALSLLDMAGDATEVLTVVFVAHYADPLLVFLGVCAGLVCADALDTSLGSRLGRVLTPRRLRYLSVVVFLTLGASIIILNL